MDRTPSIRLDLSRTTPRKATFLRFLAQVKGLRVVEDDIPSTADTAAIFRDLQVEGLFPIVSYLERLLPAQSIYTSDAARNAILDTLAYLILKNEAPIEIAKPCYVTVTEPRFLCHAPTPTILDLALAAVFVADKSPMPWATPMLVHFQQWMRATKPRLKAEAEETWALRPSELGELKYA